jgi:maltose O-acetyltransferase
MTGALGRFRRRAIGRLRGKPTIEHLVAQGMQLGVGVHLSHELYIDGLNPWLISIGDYATLSPYVALITHDTSLVHHTGQSRLGRVVVGDRVYVGVGAILLPGTNIGADSVVGAGAVVHGEIPPGSLALGNPAKASPIKGAVAWQRASAARAPSWPYEGSTTSSGITEAGKREQLEALAEGVGYVTGRPAPGSPGSLARQRS